MHTHYNPKHLRVIGFVIVPVEVFFTNCKGCLNHQRLLVVNSHHGKMFVDVVHGWYDSVDAGHSSGKVQCRILKDLTMQNGY